MGKLGRKSKGFTLIELLVVVIVIGILAGVGIPNYLSTRTKAQATSVKGNMHSYQLAAEAYSVDAAGNFPGAGTSLGPYFPGGTSSIGGTPGSFPTNPMSSVHNETPAVCAINNETFINTVRSSTTAQPYGGLAGQTAYNGIPNVGNPAINDSFAITGNDYNGNAVLGPNGVMVLSNF